MTALGKVRSTVERKLKEIWSKRMYLFHVMVESILIYEAKIWGWTEYKEIESI